jgi:hypothetical protein
LAVPASAADGANQHIAAHAAANHRLRPVSDAGVICRAKRVRALFIKKVTGYSDLGSLDAVAMTLQIGLDRWDA